MKAAKQFTEKYNKEHPRVPFISFKAQPIHTVTLLSSKEDTLTDKEGKQVEGVSFLCMEQGEEKKFFTSSIGLISQLAQCNPNDTVTIELKRKQVDGQYKSFFVVTPLPSSGSSPLPSNTNETTDTQQQAYEHYTDKYPR